MFPYLFWRKPDDFRLRHSITGSSNESLVSHKSLSDRDRHLTAYGIPSYDKFNDIQTCSTFFKTHCSQALYCHLLGVQDILTFCRNMVYKVIGIQKRMGWSKSFTGCLGKGFRT